MAAACGQAHNPGVVMSIDPIGKAGSAAGVAAAVPVASAQPATGAEAVFGVSKAAEVQQVSPPGLAEQVRAGQVDLERYLDLRVEQATEHLVGKLDAERLEIVRDALRAQLESDPMLVELVRVATGLRPGTPDGG
jgi:hypothetical protein